MRIALWATAVGAAAFLTAVVPAQTRTFDVRTRDGVAWFTDPSGNPFWSFGVDCVDTGTIRKQFDANNPSYSADRLFPNVRAWAADSYAKLTGWGFNSLGGWSDHAEFNQGSGRFPYFEVLHLGAYAKAPFADIFSEDAKKAMRDAAKTQIDKLKDDPKLVGYFSDNELGWWGDTLFTSYLKMPSAAPGKQRIMSVIRRHYGDDFARLKQEWITPATSFEELDKAGVMYLRPGTEGIGVVKAWLTEMGRYYYALVHDAIKDNDPNHLILGDRYCQFYDPNIAAASKGFIDVASTNYGATWNDGTLADFYLRTLHQLTDKPVLVTEFYMGAKENRSGNKNVPAAFPLVDTQTERAKAFKTNIQAMARLGFVVGAHWFQFYDEPPKGRGDGENFNHGLVDIYGKPYEEMARAAKSSNFEAFHRAARPIAKTTVLEPPPAPAKPMEGLKNWPREKGFISGPEKAFGDLYVCQDEKNFYLGVIEMDYMDEGLYEGHHVPEGERSHLHIAGKSLTAPIDVRFGGDKQKATVNRPDVQIAEVSGLQYTVILQIPRTAIPGGESFKVTLENHSRSNTMTWSFSTKRDTSRAMRFAKDTKTRFRVVQEHGIDWIVGPDGRKRWSFGVCCVDRGMSPHGIPKGSAAYSAQELYARPELWARDVMARLTSWGFNTVGAWSDDALLRKSGRKDVMFTPILNLGALAGAPWRDLWDPKIVQKMDEVGAKAIKKYVGDERVLGYFSDNELGWWSGAMLEWAFKAGPGSRAQITDLLRSRYFDDWAALKQDFYTTGQTSFDQLKTAGRLFLKPGGHGMPSVRAWMGVVSARYYQVCRNIVKKYDPGALYLGDRFISNFYPEVAFSAGRYCDIVSTNLNAVTNQGDFASFFLPALHRFTGKPILITEYYVAAKENRSGDKNSSSGFPVVQTQAERARVFAKQTKTLAETPYVVGAHWFQYYDEPKLGRGDGENYDMGLVDVKNGPYKELTKAAVKLAPALTHAMAHLKTAPSLPLVGPSGDKETKESWFQNHPAIPATSPSDRADLRLGYEKGNLYLNLYWDEDRFGEAYYQTKKIPENDRARVQFTVNGQRYAAHIGSAKKAAFEGNAIATVFGDKADDESLVRNHITFRVPAKGDLFHLNFTLETRGRAYRILWEGTYTSKR